MKFTDIPKFTSNSHYHINVSWDYLERQLESYAERGESEEFESLQLNPDFQRGHVWSEEQQIKYVEYKLRGGYHSSDIYFNHPGWQGNYKGEFVLVDGLQRLTAARKFMNNEIKAFGHLISEFEDRFPWTEVNFYFNVNNLKTRKEVLQWYLDLNTGGVVHSDEEINKVKNLMALEK